MNCFFKRIIWVIKEALMLLLVVMILRYNYSDEVYHLVFYFLHFLDSSEKASFWAMLIIFIDPISVEVVRTEGIVFLIVVFFCNELLLAENVNFLLLVGFTLLLLLFGEQSCLEWKWENITRVFWKFLN